nr:hypothetical protein [Tanacetum cinerariifolium]
GDDLHAPSIPSPTPPTPPPQQSQDLPSTSQRIDTSDDTVMEDASNQGRMIDDLDKDDDAVLIDETLHPGLPGPKDRVVDFPEGKIDMDLFSLIRAPNPTKVKVGSRPRAPHEVPFLTLTANRVIEMDDPATVSDSSGVSPTIERSPLDFFLEAVASDQGAAASEVLPSEDVPAAAAPKPSRVGVAAADPPAATESRKRGRDGTDANAPTKSLRRDHANPRPFESSQGERASLPYSWAWLLLLPCLKMHLQTSSPGVVAAKDPESENASSPTEGGLPGGVYRPEWGVTNGSLLDTPEACQDSYNVNLARQVALGSQLRLRFEQEAKLLRKSVAQVARRDKRIEARELEIKNLKALLETEADMKRAVKDKSAGLIKELEDIHARFSDLQVSHGHLSQQVASLKELVNEEEKLKAAFEEFKRRVVGHGLRLAMMKCAESLEMRQHGVEHGQAQLTVESIEAYDPEAEAKFVAALQSLKDLKYPFLDQLKGLKDAHMDVIMAALYLEIDTEGDAPQYIRDLRPSSSQLTIPVYPEVRDPRNPWAYKREMKLSDAIAANISRAEKKKKCRIVCRTHGVGSAHHARSDGVPVSVPTVVPQGLTLLLVDAATQTDLEDT